MILPIAQVYGVIALPDCFQHCVSLGSIWKRANLFADISCKFRKPVKWGIDLLHGTASFASRKAGAQPALSSPMFAKGRALMSKVSGPISGALLNYLTTWSGKNWEVRFCKFIPARGAAKCSVVFAG